jgi:Xaa-Pro aminopeptidase
MKKDSDEISHIKHACSVTDKIFTLICTNFNFTTEDEIRSFIESEAKKRVCELAFPSIAASGVGTSQVHYSGSKKLTNGFLMLDFGVKHKGYCSDMTRMLYLGKPKENQLADYALVLRTITDCEENIKRFKTFGSVHQHAVKILGKKSKYFTHGLGHGLGLDIHESPGLFPEDNTKIKDDVPFTIEPGIYFPKRYGIRIEDTVVMQDGRLEILTKSSKKIIVIG